MSKPKRSSRRILEEEKPKRSSQQTPEEKPNYLLITTVIATVGVVVAAIISYFGSVNQVILPIEATQTAEALHTFVAMTVTEGALQTQKQAANITMTAFSGTQTALAIQAEIDNSAIFASQTAEVQVFETQTAIAMAIPSPTEVKPIRYEHVVEVGETLREISKKYFIVDFYADAIGRANCKPSPVAGDVLVIRYYTIQLADELSVVAGKFGAKINFLRYVNNLSEDIIMLPAGQILILPGNCSG